MKLKGGIVCAFMRFIADTVTDVKIDIVRSDGGAESKKRSATCAVTIRFNKSSPQLTVPGSTESLNSL